MLAKHAVVSRATVMVGQSPDWTYPLARALPVLALTRPFQAETLCQIHVLLVQLSKLTT